MKATALVYMFDGRQAQTETTRQALADFWHRHEQDICAAVIDVNLTRWFFSHETGWERATKFRYVPNRPELWKRDPKTADLKPTTATPFDRV